ncbi:SWI/SNF and RSC complexes subunit ssr4 [Rhypophila decipiens]|uniref:SWI/SNF and RSC complexes subunit ssr4 n=1 Tax=Rhypophila decipiens TaxID=261697 RepID=A0AAN6XY94_9PEZI|nr:SWI/SNF and RSC complexes subunit ssr4 [Rhypophila decipiens]
MADDPSQNVHQDLLPHVHLLSTYRYALMSRVDIPEVTKWLTAAHKIARDTAPFYWTYLDAPQDGTIYLTWQPTAKRGLEFASDGYIWSGPEMYYRSEAGNGLVLEIYYQKAGFRMGEQIAAHSRRRFRLAPPQVPIPNMPQVDPNLWIVHYGPSEKQDRIPVNQIQIPPPMSQILNFRQYLSQMGQIVRKEFMLSDRVNWPKIPLPGRGQSLYAAPMPSRNVPQNMAYPPHPGPPGGPTPKRQRGHAQAPPHQGQMMATPAQALDPTAFDDDEDISRGDLFDHLSPREVSMSRYQQNHEWMEEILSSPYRIGQIEVADLGLGRRGELASLTAGIFEAQGGDAVTEGPKNPYTGHLDPALAEEFRKRVQGKTESTRAEIEQMKLEHAKAMEKFKGSAGIKQAELDLRASTEGTGTEMWRLEGRVEDSEEAWSPRPTKKVDDILAEVEKSVGKKAAVVQDVHRIQDGGYIEAAPEPEPIPEPLQAPLPNMSLSRTPSQEGSQTSGVMIGDSDIDMGGTAAGLLDLHGGFSATSTPINNFPTPQAHLSAIPSSVATPANMNAPSPQPAQPPTTQPQQSSGEDVTMGGADAPRTTKPGTNTEEWVLIPKGGVSPASSEQQTQQLPQTSAPSAAGNTPAASALLATSKPASAAPTPGSGFGDVNDFSSLGDLDTAGDALASYEHPNVDETALGMDMEDSAFGDAFHGVEGGSSVGLRAGGLGGDGDTPGTEIS